MTLRSAEAHYSQQSRTVAAVSLQVDRYWGQVRPSDVNAWTDLLPTVARLVGAGQVAVAREAEPYVARALNEQNTQVAPEVLVSPVGFAGMANDGVPVVDLLDLPRIQTLERIGQGMGAADALAVGRAAVTTYTASLLQDAGRQAVSTGIYARPTIGWRRMVNPPCCSDCAVLAGKWFRSNQGFDRHPNCDCTHIPAAEDAPGNVGTDPAALVASGGVRGLSPSEARALADGADLGQVVNARRGASKMFTTEGVTRRGVAGRARAAAGLRRGARPTPEAIYTYATDRDDALRLLRQNGYVLP